MATFLGFHIVVIPGFLRARLTATQLNSCLNTSRSYAHLPELQRTLADCGHTDLKITAKFMYISVNLLQAEANSLVEMLQE